MAVVIKKVPRKSPLRPFASAGDSLVSIGGNEINDLFDYNFYLSDEEDNEIEILTKNGPLKKVFPPMTDAFLEFESYLMEDPHSCKNKCIFCFIDQMPKGMRETLYFKDDDSRLSFLFGNYITLTNLSEKEVERIGKMHISPVNISVHTTNPELRVMMMKNKHAGEVLKFIPRFAEMGIKMNCQIVLCRGINDGDELRRTIEDLSKYHEAIESISVVPAGLTRHREGLYPLKLYDKESANEVINIIEEYSDKFLKDFARRLVFPSDEFFITAARSIPDYSYYEDFYQLDNGVGMVRLFVDEMEDAIRNARGVRYKKGTLITGRLFYPFLKEKIKEINSRFGANLEVRAIRNDFFGETITVTGLICGKDILSQLASVPKNGPLFVPDSMLMRNEKVFLDDLTTKALSKALRRKIIITSPQGAALAEKLLKI